MNAAPRAAKDCPMPVKVGRERVGAAARLDATAAEMDSTAAPMLWEMEVSVELGEAGREALEGGAAPLPEKEEPAAAAAPPPAPPPTPAAE